MKSGVSEICVNQICASQGVGVWAKGQKQISTTQRFGDSSKGLDSKLHLGAIHKRHQNILGGEKGLKFQCCKKLEGRS